MFKFSVTGHAFSKEDRQKLFDDFFSVIDSQYVNICGYLTLSFEKVTGTYRKVEKDTDLKL
ncbi:MAG: hypothetical protein FD156_469 [Nitrospirae bacterium]|nr:MAG: hypothetical protein FD156_469 [Nitrospirota bacterium]